LRLAVKAARKEELLLVTRDSYGKLLDWGVLFKDPVTKGWHGTIGLMKMAT
jgi:hypothetical protein